MLDFLELLHKRLWNLYEEPVLEIIMRELNAPDPSPSAPDEPLDDTFDDDLPF